MSKIQITCDTPDASIYYSINNNNLDTLYSEPFDTEEGSIIKAIGKKDGYDNSEISEFKIPQLINVIVGNTYTIDDIEVFCIKGGQAYTTGNNILIDNGTTPEVTEHPIFVDKNHDLCYYFTGSDYVNDNDYINNKWGYEWGGYEISTGITDTDIGTGLNNTNSLISMNLEVYNEGWEVIWNKISEFRTQKDSNKWFLPSLSELSLIYNNRSSLSNLSLTSHFYYWSSSESNTELCNLIRFDNGNQLQGLKNIRDTRSRLCRQI